MEHVLLVGLPAFSLCAWPQPSGTGTWWTLKLVWALRRDPGTSLAPSSPLVGGG